MINYSVLRLCSRKPKTKVRIKEISLLSIVLLLSIGVGVYAKYSYTMQRAWLETLIDKGIEEELLKLLETGQYELTVQKMENSLASYRHAHKMLGPKARNVNAGGRGMSYMFTTCNMGWSHTQRHISSGLDRFLQNADDIGGYYNKERDLHDYRQPKWQSLAQHMVTSKEPILKCTGYWMLEDKENFRISTYAATNSGDPSCNGFTLFAADAIDNDPVRSWQMTTKVWKDIRGNHAAWDCSGRIIKIGIKAEEHGVNLDQDAENFRKHILLVHESILSGGYGYDATTLPEYHKKALLKYGLKKEYDDFYIRAQKIQNRRSKVRGH